MSKKKFLVTGGAGFIGSHAVDKLLEMGHDVVVVDNECAPENDNFYWRDEAENHKVNIIDYDSLEPLMKGVDYVLHFAAESRIQPSIIDPRYAIHVNVVGTTNVLQAAREMGVKRVMYSSTSAAYGLKNKPPLKETMPTDCLNPYSVGKVGGEEVCKMYTKLFGLETVCFRYFNVYGDRSPTKGQYAPVVGLFFRQVEAGEHMTIVGDGEQRRDYTHVSDIVNANILAALSDNEKVVGELFNVGTGRNHSVNELAKLIGKPYEYIPARQGEARETLADNSKLREMLGWEPTVKFEDWIEENKPKI
jgi:UDP-glucose 4-epimerase